MSLTIEQKKDLWGDYLNGHLGALCNIDKLVKDKGIIVSKELSVKLEKAWILCNKVGEKTFVWGKEDAYNNVMREIMCELLEITKKQFDIAWENEELSFVVYTMKDLREYLDSLEDWVWVEELVKENEEEIYIAISNEEVIINKQDNTVMSSFGNYNSVHDIVEDLLNR